MSRPERRRPGAQSPLLTPQIEAVRTAPVAEPQTAPVNESLADPGRVETQPAAERPAAQVPPPVQTPAPPARPAMIDRTFKLDESLVRRMETAVLARAGGYTSMRAFVSGSIAAELARLEEAHNGGQEFPPNASEFQRGRPFGS